MLLMRCGSISVEGGDEEIISKKKKRRHNGKKSSSNPYSMLGLDKFASLKAELSAKREYVARKTGTPEAMVRFVYTSKGLAPVVVKNGHNGNDGGDLILPPIRSREYNQSKDNSDSNPRGEDDVKADEGCENGVYASASSQETVAVSMPWWSGYLKITAFGVLTVSAIFVRKSAVPAAAMAVVMVVGSLQRRWMGGVMCMKSFIDTAVSYFSELFIYWNRNLQVKTRPPKGRLQLEQPVASPEHNIITERRSEGGPLLSLSVPCSPTVRGPTMFSAPDNTSRSQDFNTQLEGKNKRTKNRQFGRIVSMDGQPRKPIRSQQSENSFWAERGEIDVTMSATLIIILLIFLVFYGRLCAIFVTSACWYVLPKLRTDSSSTSASRYNNNHHRDPIIDLESRVKEESLHGWIA